MIHVTLERGTLQHLPLFDRLMQLYLYDFSEFLPLSVNSHGLFEQSILDDYFANETKTPFLIWVNAQVAGFVLINSEPLLEENAGGKRLKEFFVLRGLRRHGIGRRAALLVFDALPHRWEVGVVSRNVSAQRFWEATINSYTNGAYRTRLRDDNQWNGPIFSFDPP